MIHSVPFADHLRGRVRGPVRYARNGGPIFAVEVVHVPTGRVLNSDDGFTLAAAVDDAAHRTGIARLAWFYGFSRKALKR